ncbi:MAG: YlxR family protein [Actinomyces sp.]|nr:YlxR family protein [Actinomyces sp.]MCI1641218.1 YlxR family protein [Actinomyces sp.]MCI1662527.1 YlxR family protein [Actinomyces sp.]MCI1692008.1 YlxR family protein [Actinomyces sp.]MCI1786839.1 YlxR family protein [Actinomyces sp.]MCI1829019.1 YlxR family protein [Actinomyces sp.]
MDAGRTPGGAPGPVRTCVGCGERAPRADLIRVRAAPDGSASVDPYGDRPGRGAWVHPDPGCIGRARSRRALTRSLRLTREAGDQVWADLLEIASHSAARLARRTSSDGSGLEADGHPMSTQR